MLPVALDAQGADAGPDAVLEGARIAAGDGIAVRVFGPGSLEASDGVEVVASDQWIPNDADPVAAVRSTPEASVVRAAADVAEGRSSALVSPGSTGAAMTAALFAMKRIKGVHRPALAAQIPIPGGGTTLLLDCGANTEVRPQHLIQFAYLGSAFSESVLGTKSPRVGLLSVGEEQKKGRPDVVEAHEALSGCGGPELHRQRRGPRPPRRHGGRDRHRRLHRQRRAEDPRGDRARGRRRGSRRGAVGTRSRPPGDCSFDRRWEGSGTSSTRTRSAARSCSACAASPWSRTEAPAQRASPTRSGSPTRSVSERTVERTAERLAASGATREGLREAASTDPTGA